MASQKQAGGRRGTATAATGKSRTTTTAQGRNGAASGRSRSPDGGQTARSGQARQGASGSGPARGTGGARTASAGATSSAVPVRQGVRGWLRAVGTVPLVVFVLSLYGLGASVYLTIAHYDTHVTLVCSGKGLVNCEQVTTSPESMVFGVLPVAVLGLAFYVFMAVINSPWGWRLSWPPVRWARIGSVVVGMGFVLYLIYAEIIEINAICIWCTSVHVATFLIFALIVFRESARPPKSPEPAPRARS